MYEKLLNIIYTYTFNYKLPDIDFVNEVINIAIDNDDLSSFVNDVSYNYEYTASYGFISKTLRFNINNIIRCIKKSLNFYSDAYDLKQIRLFEKYVYVCYEFVYTILHELEHIKQIKLLDTSEENTFETTLIQNNIDMLSINPDLYKKEHDLFPIERMAIINSNSKIIEMLKLDGDVFFILNNIYVNRYNSFVTQYYSNGRFPLLEYVNATDSSLYYEDLLIDKNNTKKILKRVKKDISFEDRVLMGLPITQKELDELKNK